MYKFKQLLGGVPGKKMLLNFKNIKWDEQYVDGHENIHKLLLLDFLLFHIQWASVQVLLNAWEILLKDLFFLIKFQPCSLQIQ